MDHFLYAVPLDRRGELIEVGHVSGHLGERVLANAFQDLIEAGPVGVGIESDDLPALIEEDLDHPCADEAPGPGDEHPSSLAHDPVTMRPPYCGQREVCCRRPDRRGRGRGMGLARNQ